MSGVGHPRPARLRALPVRILGMLCACAAALAAHGDPAAAGEASFGEYQVKAAFLRNFVKFVEWPSHPRGLLTLCVVGEDPFKEALLGPDDVGGGRMLTYRRIGSARDASGCQALFVGAGGRKTLPEVLAAVDGREVLTVGDAEGMAAAGLMFDFVIEGEKVRFEVNLDPVRRAGLVVSPKLTSLAKTVLGSR